jgi:hypothetical protein
MPSFQKSQLLKAALKLGLYGPAGSGKTFTALLIAEGLARHTGKRVAFCDTEHGSVFYSQKVPQRGVHPEAFDFDVLYSKSITEALAALKNLNLDHHGVVVIDSISHLWDACRNAYAGRLTKAGTIPLHAWAAIKKPYNDMMHLLLSSSAHVVICGRQGIDYGEDEATGELKSLGYRMRAEGETPYEPDVLCRLESHRPGKNKTAIPVAHVEKDRTGVLAGAAIAWPTFDNVAKPLVGLLGTTQAALPTDDEVGKQDAEALARLAIERAERSAELAAQYTGRFGQADALAALERIGKELTPAVKVQLEGKDLTRVRRAYATRLGQLKAAEQVDRGSNGRVAPVAPVGGPATP